MEIFDKSMTVWGTREEVATLIHTQENVRTPRHGKLNIGNDTYTLIDITTSDPMDLGPENWMDFLPDKGQKVECEEETEEVPTFTFDLTKFQYEVGQWAAKNFPNEKEWHLLVGAVEEVGELSHAYLKRDIGIRGSVEEHQHEMKDAIGDICVFIAQFCNRVGLHFESCIRDTWAEVRTRDWGKFPKNGEDE